MSAVSPSRTLARSFSYTSQTIQTDERSDIVNGLGLLNACTADALVTCWSVITPETGAKISTIPTGLSGSLPSNRRCSDMVSTSEHLRLLGNDPDKPVGM